MIVSITLGYFLSGHWRQYTNHGFHWYQCEVNSLTIILSYIIWFFFLAILRHLFSLGFCSFTIIYFNRDLFLFILLWVYLAYWIFQVSLIYQRSSQYCLLKHCLFPVFSIISFEKYYQTYGYSSICILQFFSAPYKFSISLFLCIAFCIISLDLFSSSLFLSLAASNLLLDTEFYGDFFFPL